MVQKISNKDGTPEEIEGLVGMETMRAKIWPVAEERPCKRWVEDKMSKRLIPFRKISRRVFFDVTEVRAAIDRNFTVHSL